MSTNTIAATLINYIEDLLVNNNILDTSKIFVLMDYADMTYKSNAYYSLMNEGKIDEAFAEPDIPKPWVEYILTYAYRIGVKMCIYTSRVTTDRVKEKCDWIMKSRDVPGLFHSYICIRREDQVLPISEVLTPELIPQDERNILILFCDFASRMKAFEDADLSRYCGSKHTVVLNEN